MNPTIVPRLTVSPAWLYCPRCGNGVTFGSSLQHELVRVAIQLQIQRNGTQVRCRNCSSSFVLRELPWFDNATSDEDEPESVESREALESLVDDEL